MAELQLQGVGKRFGDAKPVLDGVDLTVRSGEFMVFVGPSGCGKSTTLRLIAGLEDLSSGDIRVDGRSIAGVPPAQRGVAMVFQSYALYPHLSVANNMGFALKMAGLKPAEVRQKVGEVAEVLQLTPLLDRLPKALSGGQRQRVAIGRAIVRRPKVFLFDEPLSNLDAALRVQMRLELARLHRELGTTMVYVTHDQVEAMTLGQRIAVFNGGRVEQVGAPLQLFNTPENAFVAGFLGSPRINLFAVTARSAGAQTLLQAKGVQWSVPALPREGSYQIGVRPEHWEPAQGEDGFALQLEAIEHLGDAVIGYGRMGAGEPLQAIRQSPEGMPLRAGEAIRVRPKHWQVFDAQGRTVQHGRHQAVAA